MTSPPRIKSFLAVTKLLSKVQNVKKNWERGMLVDHLCTLKYFERLIQDPVQRQEFIQAASAYMKCKFYPKGTVICHQGTTLSSVSIIVEGKAVVYATKHSDEIQPKNHDLRRQNIIEHYVEYMQKKIVKSVASLTDAGLGSLASKKYKPSFLRRGKDPAKEAPLESPPKPGKGNFAEIVETILIQKNPLLPEFLQESDLNTEEKLLLLAAHDQLERYISHGELNMKPIATLNISDTIGGISLVKTMPSKHAFVASEDVFVVTLAREDLYFLYSMPELSNPREKIQFLEKIFPEMEEEYRMKLAFYLEERVYSSREIIYKEGAPTEAIYMVKHGEVEFTVYSKRQGISPLKIIDKLSPHHHTNKISTTNLQTGTLFGEEEIVYPALRKTSAMARHANTFLYILRKEIFNDILTKYHPEIANAFKDWIEVKVSWRRDQLKEDDEDYLDKKEALLKSSTTPRMKYHENIADTISEKIKNRKNLLRIQSSVGLKLPVKAVPMLDLNSVATPRYQERRLKGLNLNRFEPGSPEDFRLFSKNGESVDDTSFKASKLSSARSKDEPKETPRSNLFILNQKILTAKLKPSLSIQSKMMLSKRGSMSGQVTPRNTSSLATDQGLISDLKNNLLQNISGPQSARGPAVDSPKIGITMDKNLIKNKALIMLKSYSNKKELPILKTSLDAVVKIEGINNQEKANKNPTQVNNNNHRRVRSMGFHPNVKMVLPLSNDAVLTGYKTTNTNGTVKKLLTVKE